MRRTQLLALLAVVIVVAFAGGAAWGAGPFPDVDETSLHADNIQAIRDARITLGCGNGNYCPNDFVRRDQMASFLARLGGLSAGDTKNLPVANGRSDTQVYCSLVRTNPGAFDEGPCRPSITTPVIDGPAGHFSLAIGTDGLPIISYYEGGTFDDLRVVHCSTITCAGSAQITTIDSTGDVGTFSSMVIGADGFPVISYFDATNKDLKVARCSRVNCTGPATISVVDSAGDVGKMPAITIGKSGAPIVAYLDEANDDLKVAYCGTPDCSSPPDSPNTITTVDSAGVVGALPSIEVGADGLPIISHFNATTTALRITHCGTSDCTASVTDPTVSTDIDADNNVGLYSSIAIGVDGLPIVAYLDNQQANLKVTHCANVECTSTTAITTVDSSPNTVGAYPSMAISPDGRPVISYQDYTNQDLRYAQCRTNDCTGSAAVSVLDDLGEAGEFTSLAIGLDGRPTIAYWDSFNENLRVARPPMA